MHSMLQAKQELRDTVSLDLFEAASAAEGSMGRKRRPTEHDLNQLGSGYLLQSSFRAIPASHQCQIPVNFWMLANSNNPAVMSRDPIWTFPSVNNSGLYRGTMSGGLHFMNFPTPVALLPSQQNLGGSGGGDNDGNDGSGGDHHNMNDDRKGPGEREKREKRPGEREGRKRKRRKRRNIMKERKKEREREGRKKGNRRKS